MLYSELSFLTQEPVFSRRKNFILHLFFCTSLISRLKRLSKKQAEKKIKEKRESKRGSRRGPNGGPAGGPHWGVHLLYRPLQVDFSRNLTPKLYISHL